MSRNDAAIQIGVVDMTRTAPPSSPGEGDRHIVAAGATGAWAGQDRAIATYEDATWRFLVPKTGWCAWSAADSVLFVYDGAVWRDLRTLPTTLDAVTHIGVNTTASSPNLLSVRSNAALFTAINTADGGTGDARIQISKATSTNTASVVFSDSYAGRAEFGLVGSDAFKLKVSPDGSAFVEAFNIDQTSGNLTLQRGLALTGVIAPAQITSNQNDYNPASLSSASVVQLSSDAARSLSGLAGGGEGRVVSLLNTGSQTITLLDESASSLAANRFTLGGDLAVASKQAAILRYDGTAMRWFALARSGSSTGGGTSGALLAASNLSDVANKVTARSNLGVAIGSNVQAWDGNLDAVAALPANGLVARTGAGTAASRSLAGPAAGLTVTNGDGVAGNPTLALANDLAAIEGLASTGFAVRTAADAWAQRTMQAPAAGMTITNAAGVAGDPAFALANDLSALEGLGGTGLARRTGTDAWSVGTAVANAELASMASSTFKGNVSGSTAAPSDLTVTQVTSALNAMVGDSGSGGTKGLVPAPGPGDAAAGKFLKADGTFAVPPGTGGGGGGSYPDINRQNALLAMIYQAKLLGGYRRAINEFYDGFTAADGINSGSSTNYARTSSSAAVSYVAPTATSGSSPSYSNTGGSGDRKTGSVVVVSQDSTATFRAADNLQNGVDGSTAVGSSTANVFASNFTVDSSHWLKYDFGSGASKIITEVKWYQGTADSHGLWKWQGSSDNATWTDIGSSFTLGGSTTQTQTSMSGNNAGYRYYRLIGVSGTASANPFITEIEFKIDNYVAVTVNNMTLVSTAQTADTSVSKGRVLMEYDNAATPTLNTDLTVEVTCNGGTNWTAASLSAVTSYSQGSRKVAETVDQACTSGTSFAYRIKTLNNKNVPIYGASLVVH